MAFSGNAFTRSLGGPIDRLTLAQGVHAMRAFHRDFRPQHAELDELECSWGPAANRFEFAITRRMRRHDHPETRLSLVFEYTMTESRRTSGTATELTDNDGYRAVARGAVLARRLD
jgi:hypothetical protein